MTETIYDNQIWLQVGKTVQDKEKLCHHTWYKTQSSLKMVCCLCLSSETSPDADCVCMRTCACTEYKVFPQGKEASNLWLNCILSTNTVNSDDGWYCLWPAFTILGMPTGPQGEAKKKKLRSSLILRCLESVSKFWLSTLMKETDHRLNVTRYLDIFLSDHLKLFSTIKSKWLHFRSRWGKKEFGEWWANGNL